MKNRCAAIGTLAGVATLALGVLTPATASAATAQVTVRHPQQTRTVAPSDVYFISASAFSIGSCKAWMNGRTPGPYVQGLVRSWGDTCEMALWRYHNGTWTQVSATHGVINASDNTTFYWDGAGYVAEVCLTDYSVQPVQGQCSSPY